MAKMNKLYYYTSKGEKKLNCFTVPIPKEVVEKANLVGKDLKIVQENDKIIISAK